MSATDTVSSSITGTSATITVSAATATKLKFIQQPTDELVNDIITPSVTVQAADAYDNATLTGTGNVTVSLNIISGNGTCRGR